MPTVKGAPGRDAAKSLAEKTRQWVSSEQGRTMLSETVRQAIEATDRLRDAQRVDPKTLQEPITL